MIQCANVGPFTALCDKSHETEEGREREMKILTNLQLQPWFRFHAHGFSQTDSHALGALCAKEARWKLG